MLLIWGFKVRFKLTAAIVFFCPTCGGDRHGHQGQARRWFTFFWIPIIPLKVVGEFVQCDTCHTRYDLSVLDRPTTASLSEVLYNAVRAITVLVVGAGDRSQPSLRAAAVADIRAVVADYGEATLDTDLAAIDPSWAEQYVGPLTNGLEVAGKERFLGDLTRVALAGGTITDDQRRLFDIVGRGIGLTPAHITGIIQSVVSASSPSAPPSLDPPAP